MDLVILTALEVEFTAVLAHLTDIEEDEHPETGTIYETGTFASKKGNWTVAVAQIGAGNVRAASEAERAISYFKPTYMFFVGVAGGLKDVVIGDVVAATKVYGYETGKAGEVYKPRFEFGVSAYSLEQRSKATARKPKWLNRIIREVEPTFTNSPQAFIAPIAAGEKVVSSNRSQTFQLLQQNCSDALAVEMEGIGFLESCRANQQVKALLVRGISDLIEQKSAADEQGSQVFASENAAAFAFEVLANLKKVNHKEPTSTRIAASHKVTVANENKPNKKGLDIVNIFIASAYEDEQYLTKLERQLNSLKNAGKVTLWDRRKIMAGSSTKRVINEKLQAAHILLLLVSADYLSSLAYSEIQDKAFKLQRDNKLHIIPILLKPCLWKYEPFAEFDIRPTNGKPITSARNSDEAFLDVVEGIQEVVLSMLN